MVISSSSGSLASATSSPVISLVSEAIGITALSFLLTSTSRLFWSITNTALALSLGGSSTPAAASVRLSGLRSTALTAEAAARPPPATAADLAAITAARRALLDWGRGLALACTTALAADRLARADTTRALPTAFTLAWALTFCAATGFFLAGAPAAMREGGAIKESVTPKLKAAVARRSH